MGKRDMEMGSLVENNIQMVYLEEETPDGQGTRDNLENDPFELTHAQQMFDLLKNRDQIDHIQAQNDATDELYLDNTPKPKKNQRLILLELLDENHKSEIFGGKF